MTIQKCLAVSVSFLFAACGGSGPSGPDPVPTPPSLNPGPPVVTLTFVDGLGGQPAANAAVSVNGQGAVMTNENGQIPPGSLRSGSDVDIVKRGYFDRVTNFGGEPRFTLWPAADPEYVRQLVYSDYASGTFPLRRPALDRVFTVSVSSNIESNPRGIAVVERHLVEASRIAQGRIRFSRVAQGGDIEIKIDPNDRNPGEHVYLKTRGYEITGATIVLDSMNDVAWEAFEPNIVVHSLGHFLGFRHSRVQTDVMGGVQVSVIIFTPREEAAWAMMAQRRPGNQFPDSDRGL